jgi:hypothetical protein
MYGTYVKNLRVGDILLRQGDDLTATVIELSRFKEIVKIRYSNGNECWIDDFDMRGMSLVEAICEAGA